MRKVVGTFKIATTVEQEKDRLSQSNNCEIKREQFRV